MHVCAAEKVTAGAGINCSAAAATWRGGDAEDSNAWDYSAIPGSELQLSSSNADEGEIPLPAEQRLTPGAETLEAAMGLMENHQE